MEVTNQCIELAIKLGKAQATTELLEKEIAKLSIGNILPSTIERLLRSSREGKIQLIKEVRTITGLGLAEAKDLVERAGY